MSAETVFVSSEVSVSSDFDVFALKRIQKSVLETIETVYTPIATVDQSDLEFLIPVNNDTSTWIPNSISEVN